MSTDPKTGDAVTPADIAAELMLDAARDIDALAISERLDETEMPDEPDGFAEQVAELVKTASITIDWPDTSDGIINVGDGLVGALVAKLGQERDVLGVKVDDQAEEIGRLRAEMADGNRIHRDTVAELDVLRAELAQIADAVAPTVTITPTVDAVRFLHQLYTDWVATAHERLVKLDAQAAELERLRAKSAGADGPWKAYIVSEGWAMDDFSELAPDDEVDIVIVRDTAAPDAEGHMSGTYKTDDVAFEARDIYVDGDGGTPAATIYARAQVMAAALNSAENATE